MTPLQAYLNSPRARRALSKKPGEEGFSLIELVVVVAVLAVLSAIAIPSFTNISGKARATAAANTLPTIAKECAAKIADTGSGISQSDQEKIFDRFYRVENAVHTEQGTGLGLSIVRGIIEKHGGEIRMASELGVGTTFWFDLALAQSDKDELLTKAINN